ncbi:MAG: lytic transglycosylase domain-containing protein [Pasteurella sp.]|nr:lytic transglycosylase domain-containing protein [Pasteurella sp.]
MFELLGCPIAVEQQHMSAVVLTESSAYPYAVGVVGHYLNRQPNNKKEATELVRTLKKKKINYSVGLAQVNQSNFANYGITESNMFDSCTNITVGSRILKSCYDQYKDWDKAYSCYYSGNPTTGFKHGYVKKVKHNFGKLLKEIKSENNNDTPLKIYPRKSNETIVVSEHTPSLLNRRLASLLSKQ